VVDAVEWSCSSGLDLAPKYRTELDKTIVVREK